MNNFKLDNSKILASSILDSTKLSNNFVNELSIQYDQLLSSAKHTKSSV